MVGIARLLLCSLFIAASCLEGKSADVVSPQATVQSTPTNLTDDSQLLERQEGQLRASVLLALIPIVLAFSFVVFIFYRKKREAHFKQTEAELKLGIANMEIKALRAQINPHFIFNCLNSIHHYMHRNNIKMAGEYLIKFSQLIRYVLETSSQRMVALTDDLEALKLYMELEQLRMDGSFEFSIQTETIVNPGSVMIPPMMIQPFVENSIWHGLNHKGPGGKIEVIVSREGEMIKCLIRDNGQEGKAFDHLDLTSTIKKTSLGMSLIKERLEVVSHLYKVKAYFNLEDRMNDPQPESGKRVVLVLPFEE